MIAAERQIKILEILSQKGSARTTELSNKLHVTEETIRRDLEQLDHNGSLKRTHGGAIKKETSQRELSYKTRQNQNQPEKRLIAQTALTYIEPNDVIYVDASSTALELISLLGDFPVTVITNSLPGLVHLGPVKNVTLIAIGGEFDSTSQSFFGPAAQRSVQHYRVDKLFCSGNGISADQGVSEINEWQACIKERVIGHSRLVYYLAHGDKIGKMATYFFSSCDQIDYLITNPSAPAEELEKIRDHGVNVSLSK